ncbi:AEC family transporter [Adlercreutzia murintestinalis]|jgi:Predicted permeases|uniref:AEC family transporter n=1 Tax=Adlercreutzia murintestinalis TaxID=2941325 RepID=UPI0020413D3A|nr:AEC family transporter [Adlercreutzia murintestinalis]
MIFQQTLEHMAVFFLVFAVGFAVAKVGVVKEGYLPGIAQIITKVLLPAMIFFSTYANCTRQTIIDNGQMVLLAALFYALISLIMFIVAKALRIEHDKDRVFQFCFIFGNTGFVGIPLLAAVFPDAGLVYMMMFSIVDQLVFWTYGVWLSTERDHHHSAASHISWRSLITPNTVAIMCAVAFVLLEAPVPGIIQDALGTISSATSGLCMLYLGALASFSHVVPVLRRPELYVGIVVKMIVLPVVIGRALMLVGLFPQSMVLALSIIMALPVMTVVPLLVATNGKESEYATGITVATLVVSIFTIPLVVFLVG